MARGFGSVSDAFERQAEPAGRRIGLRRLVVVACAHGGAPTPRMSRLPEGAGGVDVSSGDGF